METIQPTPGSVQKAKDLHDRISKSRSSFLSIRMTVFWNFAIAGIQETLQLQFEIDEVFWKKDGDRLFRRNNQQALRFLQERFEANEGYTNKTKAEEVLEGIGF